MTRCDNLRVVLKANCDGEKITTLPLPSDYSDLRKLAPEHVKNMLGEGLGLATFKSLQDILPGLAIILDAKLLTYTIDSSSSHQRTITGGLATPSVITKELIEHISTALSQDEIYLAPVICRLYNCLHSDDQLRANGIEDADFIDVVNEQTQKIHSASYSLQVTVQTAQQGFAQAPHSTF